MVYKVLWKKGRLLYKNKISNAFNKWQKRTEGKIIKAICKPCWELKYCPYGLLVESFPLSDDEEYDCNIFGHQCPVFRIAEPFTETKELRNISRNIPQVVKLRVFRRDNSVCQICGENVALDEINYDHIIPWSKGGSSDEGNIRILCESCNKKRSNNFENEYLIAHMKEAFHEPIEINLEMLEDLLRLFLLMVAMKSEGIDVSEEEYCLVIKSDDIETDHFMYNLIVNIEKLLITEQGFIKYNIQAEMLKYRWGIKGGQIHSIKETCNKFNKDISYYVEVEMFLLRQLGFMLEKKYRVSKEYYDMVVTLDD